MLLIPGSNTICPCGYERSHGEAPLVWSRVACSGVEKSAFLAKDKHKWSVGNSYPSSISLNKVPRPSEFSLTHEKKLRSRFPLIWRHTRLKKASSLRSRSISKRRLVIQGPRASNPRAVANSLSHSVFTVGMKSDAAVSGFL